MQVKLSLIYLTKDAIYKLEEVDKKVDNLRETKTHCL